MFQVLKAWNNVTQHFSTITCATLNRFPCVANKTCVLMARFVGKTFVMKYIINQVILMFRKTFQITWKKISSDLNRPLLRVGDNVFMGEPVGSGKFGLCYPDNQCIQGTCVFGKCFAPCINYFSNKIPYN